MRKLHATILPAVALLAASAAAGYPGPEDFNAARLRAGQDFFDEKSYLEAIDQFRVAAFGYLDQPALLSDSLIRLAVAQSAASKAADLDATLVRFLEVERRFPSYPPARVPPELLSDFRGLLLRRVPQETLLSIPTLAVLIETEEQKIAKLPPAQRKTVLEAAARREPKQIRWPLALARDSLDRGEANEAERWADKALAIEQNNPDALALRSRARVAKGDCAGALKDLDAISAGESQKRPELSAERFVCLVEVQDWAAAERAASGVSPSLNGRADVVRATQKLAQQQRRSPQLPAPAAPAGKSSPATAGKSSAPPPAPAPAPAASGEKKTDVDPVAVIAESKRLVYAGKTEEAERLLTNAIQLDDRNRDLRLALLEAACLGRAYQIAAAQIPLVQPFAETEAPSIFYAAVVMYETGRLEDAQGYLRRAMPRVSGPLVDEYSRKILGSR